MTTRTTTARIRWEDIPVGGAAGFIGTLESSVFHIWQPPHASGEWVLTTELAGIEGKRHYRDDIGDLKAEAEHWLDEFVSSLGAIFPAALREHIKEERAGMDHLAADHDESGHDWQTERCYGAVEALDRLLATMDRMEAGR